MLLQQRSYFRNTDRLLEGTQDTYQLAWDYFYHKMNAQVHVAIEER